MLAISQDVTAGRGITVLLQGEGGIGKSRLLEELAGGLAAHSSERGEWLMLQGSCSPFDDRLSYGPFVDAFQSAASGELIDLLTESYEAAPDARGRFFWRVLQAIRALARNGPLLITVDDLQWANSSTLNLFGFLAMRLRGLPVMLVGTVQHAEAIPALQRLITLGRRRGELHVLSLSPLPLDAVTTLLDTSGVSAASVAPLAEWLHAQSGGSPFILEEILAQMRADAILTLVSDGWRLDTTRWLRWRATFTLPETTYDLVAWRLANLSPAVRHLLDVLAVAGRPLPFALLSEFPGVGVDQLILTVDDLVSRRLIVEAAGDTYALPHHLLRETLIHRLSNLRLRTIHRQLAEAMESCPAFQTDLPMRQIALHAVAGEDISRARRYGLKVLADLPQTYAGAETVNFLHHLHDLLASTVSPDEMLRLTHALGRLHQSLGHLQAAAHWRQQNLDIAQQTGDALSQAAAYFEMGELALVTNDYAAAAMAAQSGLAACAASTVTPPTELTGRGHRLLGAAQIAARLKERSIWNTGPIDRGFMDSIYFRDPNGQLLEMACFKFAPPEGYTVADVLSTAHRLRVAAGDYAINESHLADAIAELVERKAPLLEPT